MTSLHDDVPNTRTGGHGATMGRRLTVMRQRSGRSLAAIAKGGGWKGTSSVQRYFEKSYDPAWLHPRVSQGLIKGMCGCGPDPVKPAEIMALTGNTEAPGGERAAGRDMLDLSVLSPANRHR